MPFNNMPAVADNWRQESLDLIAHWQPGLQGSTSADSLSLSWPSLAGTETRQTLVFRHPLEPVLLELFEKGEWDLRSELLRRCEPFSDLQWMTIEIIHGSDLVDEPSDPHNHPPVPLSNYSDEIMVSATGRLMSWDAVRRDESGIPREIYLPRNGTVAELSNLLKLTTPAVGQGIPPVDSTMAHRTGFAALELQAAVGSRPAAPKGAWPGAPRGR